MSQTITVSNDVYAAIVARRLDKDESEDAILARILIKAGTAKEVHSHEENHEEEAHLILDSDMDHKAE